ncbi:MAG: hypothetical protein GF308_08920 [Candidatus Heimdallarchaeota archaeon]|nr:hypothetical protein [Candidatus Heimdallarchaeota archaeon]
MKPTSLCLVQMGEKGLELVEAYPKTYSKEVLNQIVIKSMPLNAKEGDFSSATVGPAVLSGYVFSIPSIQGRDNIASLVAVFESMKYNPETIRKIFSYIIIELKKNDLVSIDTLKALLPKLYSGITQGQLRIKISSVVTLDFSIQDEEQIDEKKKSLDDFRNKMWK